MKWRNQTLALLCLLAFAGLGVLYFRHWVVQKPFAIILFVGEGLSTSQIAPTRLFVGGADARLTFDSMPHIAHLLNASRDFAVPDPAAAASALATGVRVNNRSLSSIEGKPVETLLELARASGRATGLVTNGKLTDPAAAAFYSHAANADDAEQIARDLVEHQTIDVAIGGGSSWFLPQSKRGQRQDGRDLTLELRGGGFDVIGTRAELEDLPAWRHSRVFAAVAPEELPYHKDTASAQDQPSLSGMVRRAIELLQYNARGYVLVVDVALMRKAAQGNDAERTLDETAELDRALATARRYAGPKSTIVVAGDVAVGGIALNGAPFLKESGIAVLGLNSAGEPWITWATGPKAPRNYGAARLNPKSAEAEGESPAPPTDSSEPAAFYAPSALTNAFDVPAFGVGLGTDALHGTMESRAVFQILRNQL